jgi:acetyl-CoA/propionyl-CoA carboxylase biotin carboxyl carrier protein
MRLRRVLIANRGEIAIRIIRACREMEIESVAVYSDADAEAPHVLAAGRAVRIGPPAPAESYLSIPAVIEAARSTGSDAVHPGYGFLSENASFARACEEAGLVFVGPPAGVIERMGSKIAARELMEAAKVPVVPGMVPHDQSDAGVVAGARAVGYPVLVKASAGGGGKGMRVVRDDSSAVESIQAARRESSAAFGDGTLYVERLIERPRHVEIQVFGDAHGAVVHLFERECSIQRRHQKVVEESPSPGLTPAVRRAMGEAAVAAARAAGYRNAGTIEFLLEGEGDAARFYFLEMNTRLQVEHPITEAVTGVDLVRAQLTVAAGGALPWTQDDLSQRGHAIECRIYAEDPGNGFLPQAGALLLYREPHGPGVRVDSGVREGGTIPVYYDPLLAKLTVLAESRQSAIARALAALRSFPILGIRTNIPFLIRLLDHQDFRAARLHTGFIEQHLDELIARREPPAEAIVAAAVTRLRQGFGGQAPLGQGVGGQAALPQDSGWHVDPWTAIREWGR